MLHDKAVMDEDLLVLRRATALALNTFPQDPAHHIEQGVVMAFEALNHSGTVVTEAALVQEYGRARGT